MEQSSNQLPGIFWGGGEEREKEKPQLRSPYNWKHMLKQKKSLFKNAHKIFIWCTNPNPESSQAIPKQSLLSHLHLNYYESITALQNVQGFVAAF